MNNIVTKKINALQNILNSYEIYKGHFKSDLEIEIYNLKDKINEEDFNSLVTSFHSFKQYIFNILASTRRVYIKLSKEEQKQNDFSDIDKLFNLEELEELEN